MILYHVTRLHFGTIFRLAAETDGTSYVQLPEVLVPTWGAGPLASAFVPVVRGILLHPVANRQG